MFFLLYMQEERSPLQAEAPGPALSDTLCWLGISLALFALLSGNAFFWHATGPTLFPGATWPLLLSAALVSCACLIAKSLRPLLRPQLQAVASLLLLVLFGDWLTRGFGLYEGPLLRGEVLFFAGLAYLFTPKVSPRLWLLLAAGCCLLLLCTLLTQLAGRLLYSDDNSVFLYRLTLLREQFPHIPFYNPLWNAGIDQREFFATGVLNIFVLAQPILWWFGLPQGYNLIVGSILFGLLPLCTFLGSRLLTRSLRANALSVLLSISASVLWYRWGLKYGTLGFLTSAALAPLVFALLCKLLSAGQTLSRIEALALVFSGALCLCWPPAGLIFLVPTIVGIGLVLSAAMRADRPNLLRKKNVGLVLCALLLFLIPYHWSLWSVSKVGSFLNAEKPQASALRAPIMLEDERGGSPEPDASAHAQPDASVAATPSSTGVPAQLRSRAKPFSFARSLRLAREHAIKANILLLLFTLPGLLLLPALLQRWLFAATIAALLFAGLVLTSYKPQLELDRMLLIAALLATLPAGLALDALLPKFTIVPKRVLSSRLSRALSSLVIGFLCAGLCSVGFHLRNRGFEQYAIETGALPELAAAVNQHGGEGRVLFAGFWLHELSQGHLAPLALLTKQPLIARSQVHDHWNYKELIPYEYLIRGDAGIDQYLDLHNVSAVITHRFHGPEYRSHQWRSYYLGRPGQFRERWSNKDFVLFERLGHSPRWAEVGQLRELQQSSSGLSFIAESEELVLRFRYVPYLQSSSCTLSEQKYPGEISMIKLKDCRIGERVEIRMLPLATRLLLPYLSKLRDEQ